MILGKKIKIWYTVPCFSFQTRWFTIFVNSKITFWWYSQIAWPIVIDLVEVVFTSLFYHREWLKPGQGNFTGPSHKALSIWKRSFFCKISEWQPKNFGEYKPGKLVFFIFQIMLSKCVHMSWIFQGALNSSISLFLKLIFMYLTHFIQIVGLPLTSSLYSR